VTEDDINALLDGKDTDQRDWAWHMLDKSPDGAISMQEVMEATGRLQCAPSTSVI
jgi:hypothetical protein